MAANQSYFHLAAFYGSVTNGVPDMAVPGVNDSILTRNQSNNFILPQAGKLRLAYGAGPTMVRYRINTPSMRVIGLPYLAPVNGSLTVPSPPNLYDPSEYGPTIPVADEIEMDSTISAGAPENNIILAWFQFPKKEVPSGQNFRLRFTATITGSAGVWANGSLVPAQTLPAGVYSVIGMDAQGTNLVGARLIFAGGGWRPGCLARNTLVAVPRGVFTDGSLGVYGEFDSVNLPNLEIICSGACTAQEVYLDVVRTGNR